MKRYIHLKLLCVLALAMGAGILLHFGIGTPYRVMAQNYEPQDTHIAQAALGTAFTYQGRLIQNNVPVSATCDFQFALYDAASGGNLVGSPQTASAGVSDGYFNATLDFGDIFQGDARYLSIAVQCPGDVDFVPLDGRVALHPAPYANYASSAPWIGLNGVPAGFADGLDDDTTYNAGDGLSLTGTTFDISYSGSGSATTVARSDHDHWGQTWSGTGTGLVITGTNDWTSLLEITNNGAYSADGLRATAGGSGSGVMGRNLTGTGPGTYGCSSSSTCALHGGSIGVQGFSGDPGGYGVYGIGNIGVFGLGSSTSGAGGRFVNMYAGSQSTATTALWTGAYQSDLIQGHQTNFLGDSTAMPFRVDYTGTVHAAGGYFTRTDDYALVADGPALDYSPNPEQIALLRWYDTISPDALQGIYVGSSPRHAAFDGDHIWVTNANDQTVTKIRASDGAIIGTYPLGTSCGPNGIAFDGLSMWIGCWSDQVIEMRARDGLVTQILNFPAGSQPRTVAFDGRYVWAARGGDGRVTRMLSHSPTVSDTFTVGGEPSGLAFDGRYMWVTNYTDGTVTRLLSATPSFNDTFAVGAGPRGIAFDGARMWVGNAIDGTVISLRVTDGTQVSSTVVADIPSEVVFDGGYIWVTSYGGDTVTKVRAIDGNVVGSYFAGSNPLGMAFDGANVWVVSSSLGVVSKH